MNNDMNARMIHRHETEQMFYGWFDDADQAEPSYSPPLGAPCPLCGKIITLLKDDVRTHNLMYQGPQYAKRSYFYRTRRTCADLDSTQTAADGFILDMIARNGD